MYILQSEWLSYLVEFGFISHPAFHHSTELSTGEAPPGVSHKGNGLRVAWRPEPQDEDAQMALEQPGLLGLGELLQRPRQAGATQLAVRQHGPQRSSVFPRPKPITGIVRVGVSGASFRANRYLRSSLLVVHSRGLIGLFSCTRRKAFLHDTDSNETYLVTQIIYPHFVSNHPNPVPLGVPSVSD
jgi:hypothetical protein